MNDKAKNKLPSPPQPPIPPGSRSVREQHQPVNKDKGQLNG